MRTKSAIAYAHRPTNDKQELHCKGIKLLDTMLTDYTKKKGQVVADISYHDMMSKEEVPCYVGYDAINEKIMKPQLLHDPKINEEITDDSATYLYNFVRHLVHIQKRILPLSPQQGSSMIQMLSTSCQIQAMWSLILRHRTLILSNLICLFLTYLEIFISVGIPCWRCWTRLSPKR